MSADRIVLWTAILVLGLGTALIRFSFPGLVGNWPLPEGLLRQLRYRATAVVPGLVAPMVLWPAATGYQPDIAPLVAAAVTVLAGVLARSGLWAMVCGAAALSLTPVLPGLTGG